ncbi:MAG: aspartyl/glutamyl-tRNA amidotransferase subunit A [Verrucomicrobia bacterium GWF2_51_19]|nr:MAG: aspartyl/glutamyl-tRNA amidotransferase subunit A [Verrucomicrobia bacterium GWF2_51_19]HAD82590.1 Asp-tRNA(Asn)/Glu-tRNA(Gln) amidotransferase GatCAB subunit A [Candidatus Edwardsbacteria bacterium]
MSKPLYYHSAEELVALLNKKVISSVELTRAVIERTRDVEPKIGAFISVNEADALKQAEASDKRRAEGRTLGALDGIPLSPKDVLADENQPLTCASKILKDFISPYTGTVMQRLRNAGAVIWGRLNLDEFTMGSSNETSYFKPCCNPWNTECIPGGSSGGSAAAIAAGQTILALGSDTGGSIRQPAALCGIVGLKPTYGRVSRFGLAAHASSLDQIGPMTRTVADAALVMEIIAGLDPHDSTSYNAQVPVYREALKAHAHVPKKLGILKEFFGDGLAPDIRSVVEKALRFYEKQGCELIEISLPKTTLSIPVYYVIATAEASSNLARYDGIRYTHRSTKAKDGIDLYRKSREEGFGSEVKRRIILGTYVLSSGHYDAYYLRAQKVRTLIRNDFMTAFESVDAILCPTTPNPAFRRGEKLNDPLAMYLEDIYTVPVNIAGLPGISIPCGFTTNNLPVGLQIIGKPFREEEILGIAQTFEANHPFAQQTPIL